MVSALYSLSFLPILVVLLVERTSSLASCPPPRFDIYLDAILGSWSSTTAGASTTTTSSDSTGLVTSSNVEEVMRSCGGAVQGVKEIMSGSINDQMYHNRADDGFIFFDCGSYSSGPTVIPGHDKEDIETEVFVSNLCFLPSTESSQKSRMLIMQKGSVREQLFLKKKKFSSNSNADESIELSSIDSPPSNILWHEEILCRMSSSSQPWMLQRASWEKFTNIDENKDEPLTKQLCLPCAWMSSCDLSSKDSSVSMRNLWQSKDLGSLFHSNRVSKIIQMGAIFDDDNIKAILRCYDGEGKLKAVVLQRGTIINTA